MSKNITIQEGGAAKQMTVDKLKTNLVGGGTQLWVPEDSVELTTKNITANGTYRASDDGYYGYSEVTVNVPGGAGGPPGGAGSSIVGKDGDGDDAIVTVDPETGELEETKLPSSIKVTTRPYEICLDGQELYKDGMVVKAYMNDDTEYGVVQNSEVTLDPATAEYDESKDVGSGTACTLDGDYEWLSYYDEPLYAYHSTKVTLETNQAIFEKTGESSAYAIAMNAFGQGFSGIIWMSENASDAVTFVETVTDKATGVKRTTRKIATLQYSKETLISHKTIYYAYGGDLGSNEQQISPAPQRTDNTVEHIITLIFDGVMVPEPGGSPQDITVTWPRPGDGKELTTTFEVHVLPSLIGDDN